MADVFFYEIFKEEEDKIKSFLPKDIEALFTPETIQAAGHQAVPALLISIRTQSQIPLAWAKDLKGILARSTGHDHLLAYQKEAGKEVPCGYLPSYCARAVAEQAILMLMALFRKLRIQIKNFDQFCREGMTGVESQGKNLLVLGVGRIGSEVVDLARGLKMNVKGVDLVKKVPGLEYISLEEGLSWAQAVICALPLTEQTQSMLNYSALKQARPGIVLINIARGEISPTRDLKKLLAEKILGGVGLDVYENEGDLAECLRAETQRDVAEVQTIKALQKKENVLFTPHNAFNTVEAVERKANQSAEAVAQFLKTGSFPCPIPGK